MGYFVKGLTKKQREVFEQIAIGNDKGIHTSTAKSLIKKGLIKQYYQTFQGCLVRVVRYQVPLDVHAKWCEWCSECEDSDAK